MKYFMLLIFLLPLVLSLEERNVKLLNKKWKLFKEKHHKSYGSTEEDLRRDIFIKNLKNIDDHNKKYKLGLVKYKMGPNQFSDMSQEEIKKYIHADEVDLPDQQIQKFSVKYENKVCGNPNNRKACFKLPKQIDWRQFGAVTPVKNQGSCGCCWAFATAAVMESQMFRKTGKLVRYSEQQLMDCADMTYSNKGCLGGGAIRTYPYLLNSGGIVREETYPYEEKQGTCRFNAANIAGSIKGFVVTDAYNETQLQMAIATMGPVAVSMYVLVETFSFYESGIYYDPACPNVTKTNHAILAVGYGTENGNDYWLLKNSWGEKWGDKGYFKLARNKNNACNIASRTSFPIV